MDNKQEQIATYNFKVYKMGPTERATERMHVTVSSRGKFYFNPVAFAALGKPSGVVLMFDQKKMTIGVLPATLARKEVYRVRHLRLASGHFVSAINFLRHFSILPTATIAFPNASITPDGILILDLHYVQPVQRRWSKPRRRSSSIQT